MSRRLLAFSSLALLSGCATVPRPPAGPVEVQILGINDFHGNLEPPRSSIDVTQSDGSVAKVPAGGVAYLAGLAQGVWDSTEDISKAWQLDVTFSPKNDPVGYETWQRAVKRSMNWAH